MYFQESKFYMESADIESRIYKEKREEIYEKRRRIIDSTAFYSGMISNLKPSNFLVSTRFRNTIYMFIANSNLNCKQYFLSKIIKKPT